MKKAINFLLLFFAVNIYSQVTILVNSLPKNTPKNAKIYVSGDFENWSGGKETYKLTSKQGKHYITIPKKDINILFKFTLGSWKTVECKKNGDAADNRTYNFKNTSDTLKVNINAWSHLVAPKEKPTATKNVTVISENFKIPQLNKERRIWMYLPPDYHISKESYPVIYMHDAQNLFDKTTSFAGEWNVDETLNQLFKDKNLKAIVVGIDNGGKDRLHEYSPWKNQKYGGGEGDEYVDFIVSTLKPYIDNNYKTLKNKENTAIIGSSMGGLISHYAALKYPSVFGKVGVFSPSYWFSSKVNEFSKNIKNIGDTKFYFLAGEKEKVIVKDLNLMINNFKNEGIKSENIQTKIVKNGEHNEKLWRENFKDAVLWLFKDKIKQREFKKATFKNNKLTVNVSDGVYNIKLYNSKTAETTFIPSWDVEKKKSSHAVVLNSTLSEVKFKEDESSISLSSKGISVKIIKKPFSVSYWYNGEELIAEKNGYQRNDDFETLRFSLTKNEVLYGAGSRALGMNRRGNRLRLYNKADYAYENKSELMNFTMPLVISSKKYLLHFDNAPIGYLDLDSNKDNTLSYETISGRKTYQVVAGNSWYDLIDVYTDLTGKQPLPPRWALGNFSSRFGYHSQKETENTIQKFKEDKIPVDAVILDLYWFGKGIKGTMGNLEVYKDSFPNMKKMVSKLKNKGVKTVLITEPFIVSTSKKWKEAVTKDILAKDSVNKPARYNFYFGNTGIIDIYKKEGKQWFWNIYKDIKSLGVKGFWGDLGEPEVHPSWVKHATGTADEIHNVYGHDWAKLIYEGYQKEYPNERPFILMRAGYSGSQRFGMIPWSGDVNRTWGGLQSQPEISLQMGMQGIGYMHSDLGGFAGANLNDELYARWLQYGVFQPIYRPHAQEEVPSEPVFRSSEAKARAKKAIELRYKLLPYNYHLVYENHVFGKPLMRPLFFEYQNEKTEVLAATYLWGSDFLISPQLKEDIKEHQVYFPKETIWFDFYSDEKVIGNGFTNVKTRENSIPTYVKAGSFIPLSNSIQNTEEYNANELNIHYYHDNLVKKSSRKLYNDDGLSANSYKNGAYELVNFNSEFNKNKLKITLKAVIGKTYKAVNKNYSFTIHNIDSKPENVKVNGKKVDFNWNKNQKTLHFSVKWNTKNKTSIKIKL